MDDDGRARHERLLKEQADLQRALERSRERVGVDPEDLHRVAAAALSRAGYVLDEARGAAVGNVETYRLNPSDPAFTKDAGWEDAFDDLRIRPRKRGERLGDWRGNAPIRSIAFKPPILSDGRDERAAVTAVREAHEAHGISERRACSIIGADRSVMRYQHRRGDEAAIRTRLKELHRTQAVRRYMRKHTGCTPTKTLAASAYVAHVARRAADYGVRIERAVNVERFFGSMGSFHSTPEAAAVWWHRGLVPKADLGSIRA